MGLFWTILLISERNIAKRLISLKILQDSDFSIHFTYDSDIKSENISILHFLWQFYDTPKKKYLSHSGKWMQVAFSLSHSSTFTHTTPVKPYKFLAFPGVVQVNVPE
jgi:hypothetical protein